jgi:hypothetical protein
MKPLRTRDFKVHELDGGGSHVVVMKRACNGVGVVDPTSCLGLMCQSGIA